MAATGFLEKRYIEKDRVCKGKYKVNVIFTYGRRPVSEYHYWHECEAKSGNEAIDKTVQHIRDFVRYKPKEAAKWFPEQVVYNIERYGEAYADRCRYHVTYPDYHDYFYTYDKE